MLLYGRTLPPSRALTVAAVAVLVAGLVLRLHWFGALPFNRGIPESGWIIGKDSRALPRIVHALALAVAPIVARLVPREAAWMRALPARWLAAAGRQSLHVFCAGLFLSWAVTAVFRFWPSWMMVLDPPLMVTGCAVLLWFGLWRERGRNDESTMQDLRQVAASRWVAWRTRVVTPGAGRAITFMDGQ